MLHTLTLDHRHLPDRGGYLVRALLELQGTARTAASRVPLRLSLVIDRSGSMDGPPLEAATAAAADLVRRLAPEDVVSVVAFDDQVITAVPPHRAGGEAHVAERILGIVAGGTTNLSGGWLRGRELVSRDRADGAVHRVLLLTDGHANVGITDPVELAELAAQSKAKGITTSCVGVGDGYDEALLRAMADAGGGNAFHIERPDQAALAFGDELAGLQTLAGQNLSVTIALDDAVTLAHVHHDWPSVDGPEGRTFELGDLYAREPKRLLVEFFCATAPSPDARALARLTLRADVREESGGLVHQEVVLPIAATLESAGQEAPTITREVLLSEAARARAQAAADVRRGEAAQARRALDVMARKLSEAPMAEEFTDEVRDLAELSRKFEMEEATESDARYLQQKAYNARRGKRMYDRGFTRRRPEE